MAENKVKQTQINGLVGALSAKQDTLVSGENIRTINGNSLLGSGDIELSGGEGGGPIAMGDVRGLYTALDGKQNALVSGVSIKTVNGDSLLGSGNISISGSGGVTEIMGISGDIDGPNMSGLVLNSLDETLSDGHPITLNNIAHTYPHRSGIGVTFARQANYTGGIPGWVNGAMFLHNTVAATPTAYEWTLTSVMDNSATEGQNVGAYFQGLKRSTGPTWASVSEVTDMTYAASTETSGGLVAMEVDVFANDTDEYNQRVGVDIVVGNASLAKTGTLGTTAQIGNAIRIAPQNFNESLAYAKVGLNILTSSVAGILNQANGTYGIQHTGNYVAGIDLSQATHSDSAISINQNDYIRLGGEVVFRYNSSNESIEFFGIGGGRKGYLDVSEYAPDGPLLPAASSFVTLGTTQTITGAKLFNQTIYTLQDVSCRNVFLGTGTVRWSSPGNTSSSATGGAATIPSQAAGFLRIEIDGDSYKVPYFGV